MSRYPKMGTRFSKITLMVAADAFLLPLALWTSLGLRLDDWAFPGRYPAWGYLLPPLIAIPVFARMGLYRAVIRHMDDGAAFRIIAAVSISAWLFAGAIASFFTLPIVPRSSLLIYWLIAIFYISISRFAARTILQKMRPAALGGHKKVIIYGAGEAGRQIAGALHGNHDCRPVAFVDDNPELHGLVISGLHVYSPNDLPVLVKEMGVRQILLAMSRISRSRRVEIINALEPLRLQVRVLPGFNELVSGKVTVAEIREVAIDELLGRNSVPPDPELIKANIAGKVVMVTGAGGSIGSELCRQILPCHPELLVLYELNEFSLYTIEQELQAITRIAGHPIKIHAVLGSVQDQSRLELILRLYEVQTVYHAAAYKHVPLVESNITQGILNNTFGTLRAAQAAIARQVETFVLISTDKAVRPTNVMGASKRMAELVLQGLATQNSNTRFSMVRFGNVLNSSGSVVPLFRRQIAAGGPVTVTHPDVIRYFMTIPEAAQLVLQAGAMGGSGEVFVLDMGSPVKIYELARRMIHLSGYSIRDEHHPDGEILIQLTGLRPGEKLYEELLIGDNVAPTSHPRICKAMEDSIGMAELLPILSELHNACAENDNKTIFAIFQRCVRGFKPPEERISL